MWTADEELQLMELVDGAAARRKAPDFARFAKRLRIDVDKVGAGVWRGARCGVRCGAWCGFWCGAWCGVWCGAWCGVWRDARCGFWCGAWCGFWCGF
eukprot:273939-Chlamydomonas_euryale.AAC.2